MMGPSSSRQPWRALSEEGYDVLREARIELVIADKRINCAERRMHASLGRRDAFIVLPEMSDHSRRRARGRRMRLALEADEASNPIHIKQLGADAVVPEADPTRG